ncbi:MAG: chromosomal replication initiator protein DnaA [Bacillota bacterium]|nr:chromosomal replication initiator protein DnaA [Bacillota bacterium]
MNEIWQRALRIIRQEIPPDSFEKWFSPGCVSCVEQRASYVYICVADAIVKQSYLSLYAPLIQNILSDLLEQDVQLMVVDDSSERIPDEEELLSLPKPPSPSTQLFNPRYQFENFVVGSSNRFAHAAAMAVAESPAGAYNPLFIYGGSGLGKTHLMHAIGHAVIKRNPEKKVVYVSTEAFTNEFIYMLRVNRLEAFKNRYRSSDILLVDDIQFLMGKVQTQEEFFHTFNALHDAGRQIVISSDRPPKELSTLEDRLRSRFEWGLITDIQAPDWETRCAILQQKAINEKMDLDDEVAYFIAEKVKANIRELEGALNKVIYYSRLNQCSHIDLATAKEALRGLLPEDELPKFSIPMIQKAVADYYQITVDDLKGKRKDRFVTYPRQIAMYLCRELMGATQPQIGRDFGNRDHTTVIHAHKRISEARSSDAQLERVIKEISASLRGGK